MTEGRHGNWPFWRRAAAEFVVIVVGVLVALAVDATRSSQEDHARADAYIRQLRLDLSATSNTLATAIDIERNARDGADRLVQALNASRLPSTDSLTEWLTDATNSAASFYPTMGTVTALIESGELRLIEDETIRRSILQYHSSVQGSLRIIDAVNPYMWRTLERLGTMLSWPALIRPQEGQRFPINWTLLAANQAFHGAVYDLRLAAHNRLFALGTLKESLDMLLAVLGDNRVRPVAAPESGSDLPDADSAQ